MSSNFVDKNKVKIALITGNVYIYKNKVKMPPRIMQSDTITVSVCGVKTMKINNFINTRASIIDSLG